MEKIRYSENKKLIENLRRQAPQEFKKRDAFSTAGDIEYATQVLAIYRSFLHETEDSEYSPKIRQANRVILDHFTETLFNAEDPFARMKQIALDLLFFFYRDWTRNQSRSAPYYNAGQQQEIDFTILLKMAHCILDDHASVGLVGIPEYFQDNLENSQFKVSVVKIWECPIEEMLCEIMKIDYKSADSSDVHFDAIISHRDNLLSLLETQEWLYLLKSMTDTLCIQISEGTMALLNEQLQMGSPSSPKGTCSLTQIRLLKDYFCYVFRISFAADESSQHSLTLRYTDETKKVSEWLFEEEERGGEGEHKFRVKAYAMEGLWSLYPRDYTFFGHERLFSCENANNKEPESYPLWYGHIPDEDLVFCPASAEYKSIQKTKQGQTAQEPTAFTLCANLALIPYDPDVTIKAIYRTFYKIIYELSHGSYENLQSWLRYWLPFGRFDYEAANVPSPKEAEYRLKEWFDTLPLERKKEWNESFMDWERYKEKIAADPSRFLKTDEQSIEERFPFCKEKTTLRLFIDSWSQDGTKIVCTNKQKKPAKKRECRQQPVLNLMLYSLGITREQYKSINKSRKR